MSLAIVLVFPTAALLYRIHVEEMALTEAFGEGLRRVYEGHEAPGPRDLPRHHPDFRPSASSGIETQDGRLRCPVLDDEVQEWT